MPKRDGNKPPLFAPEFHNVGGENAATPSGQNKRETKPEDKENAPAHRAPISGFSSIRIQ